MRRIFTCFLLLAALAAQAQQPNIILFYVDDLGYGDLGAFWQDGRAAAKKFDTPALDKMAAQGAMLTQHYTAAPVCASARSSLLQGRHQGHADIRDNQFDVGLPDTHSLPGVLRAAGYRTIHVGKAGLAGSEGSVNLSGTGSQNLPAHPLHRGFDRFFGYLFHADGHEHYPRNGTTDKGAYIYDNYRQVTDASLDLYTTDVWTAFAKQAIIDEVNDGDSQPFFVYLSYETPHFKMQRPAVAYPGEDLVGGNHAYGLTGGIQWTTAIDGSGRVRYASTANGTGTVDGYTHPDISGSWTSIEKQHVGMIRRIDNSIADILQLLDDLGIDNNTICVFSSDNGPHNEDGQDPRNFDSYANLEGIKRDIWEGGIRAPTIVRWPGNIAGATGDENNIAEIDYPSGAWDWMPTFVEAAGITAPAWCDGVSLLPTLTGNGTQRDKGYLYFEYYHNGSTPNYSQFPNHKGKKRRQTQAVRIGDHMGVRVDIGSINDAFRIYDVTTDPGQAVNLAGALPALELQMRDLAIQARRPGAVSRSYIDNANVPGVANPPAGAVDYTVHEGAWTWVPEFRDLPVAASGSVPNLDLSVRTRDDDVGILFSGYIEAPATGTYTFYLESDNGSDLFIHDGHVVANDYNFTGAERSGTINLEAGWHSFRLYYRHTTGAHSLSLKWSGPGFAKQPVPDNAFEVSGPPDPEPVAADDSATVLAGSSELVDVLANDTDDGLPAALGITAVDTPLAGSAVITSDQIQYTPDAGFYGTDVFGYTISDSQYQDSATVTVDVVYFDDSEIWLPLDHVGGFTVTEAGGLDLGTVQGFSDAAAPWVAGYSGKAVELNGTSQNILLDDAYTPPTGSSARTVTAWIKTTGTGAIVAWGSVSTSNKWFWRLENDLAGTGALRIEVEGGFLRGATDLRDGQWHHVALVVPDGASDVSQCRLYVDGSEDTPYTFDAQAINTTATQVAIGKDSHNPAPRYFPGAIDEVRIYKRALSPSEIATEAALGNQVDAAWHRAFFGPDAVDWYAQDDNDGFDRFLEMALGGNPHREDRGLIEPALAIDPVTGDVTLTYRRRTAAVFPLNYTVLISNDLIDWSTLTGSEIFSSVIDADAFLEEAVFRSNASIADEPAQFIRLRVEPTP